MQYAQNAVTNARANLATEKMLQNTAVSQSQPSRDAAQTKYNNDQNSLNSVREPEGPAEVREPGRDRMPAAARQPLPPQQARSNSSTVRRSMCRTPLET